MPEAGDPAPDFCLPTTVGDLRLSEVLRQQKVLLAFYFEDATPLCTTEVSSLKAEYDLIRELGAEVVAVSADTPESHRAFAQRLGGVPFPLASDQELAAARAYGVVDHSGRRSRRALFVIDRGGSVLYAAPHYNPGNVSQLEAAFRALGLEA